MQEMQINGDILLKNDLIDPTIGNLHQIIRKFTKLISVFNSPNNNSEEILIIPSILEERISEIIQRLKEERQNWNSYYIITKPKFETFFQNHIEADVAFCQNNKAKYFSIKEKNFIEVFEAIKMGIMVIKEESINIEEIYEKVI